MINNDKWINTLPRKGSNFDENFSKIDHDIWIKTIPEKNTFNSVKKYTVMMVLFVSGFFLVSAVKNETRNLQKEINFLKANIKEVQFDLSQAILDNEVITSPENITKLAKEHLNDDLVTYKRYQIKSLNNKNENVSEIDKIKKEKIKSLSKSAKAKLVKKIEKKKTEIRKLQELYKNPDSIPGEIKTQVAKKIETKKIELKNLYDSPSHIFTFERITRWSIVQVVKVFLGMPVVPGK